MNIRTALKIIATIALATGIVSCGSGGGGGYIPSLGDSGGGGVPLTGPYVVLAWNDLGMHCLNPSYDTAVILPPYNTVWAQVIQRGNKPQVITSGITVEYRIINNTTSSNKGLFGQFWDNANRLFQSLFPAMPNPLPREPANRDTGITGNRLQGTMSLASDHFEVTGIPVVPYEDGSSVRNAYQVAEITVKNSAGTVLATTRCTVPTSDEINCAKCHAPGQGITKTFEDILTLHDSKHPTNLMNSRPVLCASCHGSPALGQLVPGTSGKFLSYAIHNSHKSRGAACYDCHPGASTSCNRSAKHTAANGNCTTCHGDMANVASSITSGRLPWGSEPKCFNTTIPCHATGNNGGIIPETDTVTTLYRNAKGHGGLYCAGCHGSPHAMVPSNQSTDNYQALQYQQKEKSLGSCLTTACHEHSTSRGGNSSGSKFVSEHGNGSSKCGICHTGFIQGTDATKWPHGYNWKARP